MKRQNYSANYFDWASAAPVSDNALRVFSEAIRAFGNPSSPHTWGSQSHAVLEYARKSVARVVGIKSDGVIFTSGATEANNLAIQGHVKALQEAGRTPESIHLLYAPTCHSSIVETAQALSVQGVSIEELEINDGRIDLVKLKSQIRPETALVSMDVVCGETGTKWDTRDVRRVLNAVPATSGSKILLHLDASQAAFAESLDMNHLGADLMTLDAQKVGGVRGVGALLRTNPLISLSAITYGGGQEQGLRPGTESPALAAAFAAALSEAQTSRERFVEQSQHVRSAFLAEVSTRIPVAVVNVGKEFVPHIINISLPGIDTDYTVMLLSEAGYAVSTKSACETEETGSRVVLALTGDAYRATSTLRISWGPTTPPKKLRELIDSLTRVLRLQGISN